jgi:hypothetical protein
MHLDLVLKSSCVLFLRLAFCLSFLFSVFLQHGFISYRIPFILPIFFRCVLVAHLFRPSFSPLFRSNSLLCFDTIRPHVTTIEPLNEIPCHLAVEVFTKIRRYVSVLIEIGQPMISLHEDLQAFLRPCS